MYLQISGILPVKKSLFLTTANFAGGLPDLSTTKCMQSEYQQ